MNRRIEHALAALMVTGLLCLQPGPAFAMDAFEIEVEANRVSIDARDAPLQPLLRELASRAGFKLWMPAELSAEPISLRLENQPLEKVLGRLLADTSYALVRDDDARLSAIFVLPRGQSQSPLVSTLGADANLAQVLENPFAAQLSERLNDALGRINNFDSGTAEQNPPASADQPAAPMTFEDISEALEQIQFKLHDPGQTPGADAELR